MLHLTKETLLMKKIMLSISNPCHERWDQMTQVEKGKFCASCQKTVVDFTGMNDRQLAEFFKKANDSTCGLFYQDQLNRNITVPRKRIPWIKYFFQFSLPAFLVSIKTYGQTKNVVKGDTVVCLRATMGKVARLETIKEENRQIHGKIVSEKNEPVPYTTVAKKGTNIATVTDSSGNFSLHVPVKGDCILEVSAVGFGPKEVFVTDPSINITLQPIRLDEVCVTMGLVATTTSRKAEKIPVFKRLIDTAFKKFSVYPNPVRRNSNMKIDLKKLEQGQYTVSIISMSGEVVQTEEMTIEKNSQGVDFHLNELTAGTYLVHVFNRKTAVSYTERIMVE